MGNAISEYVGQLAFHPRPVPVSKSDVNTLLPYEYDGRQYHVYYKTLGDLDTPDLVILHSYGNGCDTQNKVYQNLLKSVRKLIQENTPYRRVLLYYYDYPGYAKSDGKSGEKMICRAAEEVYKHIKQYYPDTPLLLWGYSIGSVPTCHLIHQGNKADGVLLVAPIASLTMEGFGVHLDLCSWIDENTFDNIDRIKHKAEVWPPTLLLHGNCDKVIPCQTTCMLFAPLEERELCFRYELADKNHLNIRFDKDSDEAKLLIAWLMEVHSYSAKREDE